MGAAAHDDAQARAAVRLVLGRAQELEALGAKLAHAREGQGGVALLSGEPGIGKTTLADAFCDEAIHSGALVVWGRCWESGGAPPFWPWTEALRSLTGQVGADVVAAAAGARLQHLARLLPELGGDAPEPGAEGEQGGFALSDAVATCLQGVAAGRPVVVVVDDLHAADPSSLLMLRLVAGRARAARLLVVGTFREAEARLDPEVQAALAEVGRDALTLSLRGLDGDAVAELVALRGRPVDEATARRLHEVTEGNPLFVSELAHLLDAQDALREGTTAVLPDGVRATIARRLALVSDATRALLAAASVVGRQFRLATLAAATVTDPAAAHGRLDEAVRAGLVTAPAEPGAPYRFAHALIRDVLYGGLAPADRGAVHAALAGTLEAQAPEEGGSVAQIAHHRLQSARDGVGDPDAAVAACAAAGAWSAAVLAHADAAMHLHDALDLLGPGAGERRCDLLLELGEAQWRSGRTEEARETFLAAGAAADALGSPERLGRAALGFGGRFAWVEATTELDRRQVDLLERAVAAQPQRDSALAAQLMARLSMMLYFSPEDLPRRDSLTRQAIAMAERVGDDAALAYCLNARRFVLWRAEQAGERREVAAQLLRAAAAAGEPELLMRGHAWTLTDALEAVDVDAADRAAAGHARLADELRQPLFEAEAVKVQAAGALLRGRLDETERLMGEYVRLADEAAEPDVGQVFAAQIFIVRALQGRIDELVAGAAAMVDRYPGVTTWRAALAYALCELGRTDEARVHVERMAAGGFSFDRQPGSWILGVFLAGETVAQLEDARHAATLHDLLAPYSGLGVVSGYAVACFGAADRVLGGLARVLGRHDEAVRRLEAAVELDRALGALPWLAWSRIELARALLTRGAPGDRERALEAMRHARSAAEDGGWVRVLEKVAELGWRHGIQSEVTLLFSDIVDSTATAERLGDRAWLELLREHNVIVRQSIRGHGGYEVKTQGDGFMVSFASPDRGLACAAEVQRRLHARNAGAEHPLRVRVGLHTGDAVAEDGDFLGTQVNLAARVAGAADAGQILVSEPLLRRAGDAFAFGPLHERDLKGFRGARRLAELRWS